MKKIEDERLVLKNLKNIRIAFIVQTIGIIGILGYDLVTKGQEGMRENPLWLIFIMTSVIFAYLSMSISIDYERKKSPQKQLLTGLIIIATISLLVGYFTTISKGSTLLDGIIMGGILFVCGFVPVMYMYCLRKRKVEELDLDE